MRRARRFLGSSVAAATVMAAALSAVTTILNFPSTNPPQEHSQWCWAGASQAILSYFGTTVSQCTIANYASGYPMTAGRPDCCVPSSYSANDNVLSGCNYWNYIWGSSTWGVPNASLQGILSHWGVNSTTLMSSLAAGVVVTEVDARRPIVMRFGWKTNGVLDGSGHFLDIYGYAQDGTYLDYWNPMPGWGATRALYTWAADASDHQWTHTLKLTTSPPANPPVFTDDPLNERNTPVKVVHITDLRQKIDSLRVRYRLSAFTWTDATLETGVTRVRAVHLTELRTALADVFTAAGRTLPSYAHPTITPGVTEVAAADIAELRAAITGLW